MTTQEIANRYMELEKQGKWQAIQDELYSQDIVSVEPSYNKENGGVDIATGIAAIKEKGKVFNDSISEMHSGYCTEPVVAGNHFTLTMGMDVTLKNGERIQMDEVAVFATKDGKIVLEHFFF